MRCVWFVVCLWFVACCFIALLRVVCCLLVALVVFVVGWLLHVCVGCFVFDGWLFLLVVCCVLCVVCVCCVLIWYLLCFGSWVVLLVVL